MTQRLKPIWVYLSHKFLPLFTVQWPHFDDNSVSTGASTETVRPKKLFGGQFRIGSHLIEFVKNSIATELHTYFDAFTWSSSSLIVLIDHKWLLGWVQHKDSVLPVKSFTLKIIRSHDCLVTVRGISILENLCIEKRPHSGETYPYESYSDEYPRTLLAYWDMVLPAGTAVLVLGDSTTTGYSVLWVALAANK